MKICLWLDDERDPEKHGYKGWVWVKTAKEAINLIGSGNVYKASLDHDLGTKETGYDVVCWMEEYDKWPVDGTQVHSANPVGRSKMMQAISRYYNNAER